MNDEISPHYSFCLIKKIDEIKTDINLTNDNIKYGVVLKPCKTNSNIKIGNRILFPIDKAEMLNSDLYVIEHYKILAIIIDNSLVEAMKSIEEFKGFGKFS